MPFSWCLLRSRNQLLASHKIYGIKRKEAQLEKGKKREKDEENEKEKPYKGLGNYFAYLRWSKIRPFSRLSTIMVSITTFSGTTDTASFE